MSRLLNLAAPLAFPRPLPLPFRRSFPRPLPPPLPLSWAFLPLPLLLLGDLERSWPRPAWDPGRWSKPTDGKGVGGSGTALSYLTSTGASSANVALFAGGVGSRSAGFTAGLSFAKAAFLCRRNWLRFCCRPGPLAEPTGLAGAGDCELFRAPRGGVRFPRRLGEETTPSP